MWRQAGFPPIVLSSDVRGHPPPDWCSRRLGNLVLRSFLGYAVPIPVYFELSVWCQATRAFRVRFETIGFTSRQPGFLPNHCDDALWQELKQERFATLSTIFEPVWQSSRMRRRRRTEARKTVASRT